MITPALVAFLLTTASVAQEPVRPPDDTIARLELRISELERQVADQQAQQDTGDVRGEAIVVAADEVLPEAVAFGAPVHVHGAVTGKVVSFGDDVRVFNGGRVGGDAVSFGGSVIVEPGAAVVGDRITYSDPTEPMPMATASMVQSHHSPDGMLRTLARKLVLMLTLAGAGVLVVGLFPRHVNNVAATVSARPMKMGFLGVGSLTGGLLLALLLALTVLLSPFALALAALLGLAWMLGFVGLCQAVGDRLPLQNQGLRRWLAFLIGIVTLAFVGTLPWIGQVVLGLVSFICVGAALHTRFGMREADV
ncbi:MAG: hypothetical protein GY913_27480 [Proteobacteria bacterium]|nr:hypothetical protein [Pseudomonadota bacterium]MCP4920658.1 hypothetical protein [Pseudomonadota bacterium]